jgi:hypothetical protein
MKSPAQDAVKPPDARKDSTRSSFGDMQLPGAPIPFLSVDKPDLNPSSPSKSPEVPLLVVEKTDNKPAYGDDFGDKATIAQRVAHDMRAADASPDKLIVRPEAHVEPGTAEDQAAPLFRHESFQPDRPPSTPALRTIEETSAHSWTEQTSSEGPASPQLRSERGGDPLFSHEAGSAVEHHDELNAAPLLSHETGLNGEVDSSDDGEHVDELDLAPLLPHETGFRQYKSSGTATSDFADDISEPQHYSYHEEGYGGTYLQPDEAPTFTHEDQDDENDDYEDDDTPLLPHERDPAIADGSSPVEDGHPSFPYETDSSKTLFGGSGRPGIFRARTNSSNLPHRLPRSDEDDENLDDPSLERFPTNREQILQRVATIGQQLPEDQTVEGNLHSPVMSVMSQACSSVDLAPVKSYASLASVPEADDSDEDGDLESLPSPMVMNFGRGIKDFARDPHATPMPQDGRRLEPAHKSSTQSPPAGFSEAHAGGKPDDAKQGLLGKIHDVIATPTTLLNAITPSHPSNHPQSTHSHPAHSAPANSTRPVEAQNDGRNDELKHGVLNKLHDAIATPTTLPNGLTSPLTPEKKSHEHAAPATEAELRQRQVPNPAPSAAFENEPENNSALKRATPHHLDRPNETYLQAFFRVVFGSVGRLLTACVGGPRRAG